MGPANVVGIPVDLGAPVSATPNWLHLSPPDLAPPPRGGRAVEDICERPVAAGVEPACRRIQGELDRHGVPECGGVELGSLGGSPAPFNRVSPRGLVLM